MNRTRKLLANTKTWGQRKNETEEKLSLELNSLRRRQMPKLDVYSEKRVRSITPFEAKDGGELNSVQGRK